ncbi:MAG: phosphoenolpyruvate--protein phosphotransferase [Actinobacteria bacterium 69-20]|nr:phosphoenolpyruvate--protein phosphotransferase [Actinomycetota bacterium]OJV23681.1 MAG: phosphoenolpyruvate--protein phosphotransferase [Actinobacteria bacterium 69-20]
MRSRTTFIGTGVGRGSAVGPAVVVGGRPSPPADETVPADLDEVMGLLEGTLAVLADSFRTRAESMDGEIAEIFEATAMMAEDPTLRVRSRELIESGLGPATAIDRVTQQMADALSAAGGYLAERVTDLMSIRDRVIARLLNLPEPGIPILSAPSVILACDLAPADTALIDLNLVLGIATEQGGPTGHVAIIAGQYGIPCVIGAPGVTGIPSGSSTVVDAARGIVISDPSPEDVAAVTRRREAELRRAEDSGAGETADGHKVEVLANIGAERDVDRALATVHDGIGLFRTEFLYLDRRTAPGVDEQADRYRKVLRAYAGRKVVVRTLDAGADKPLAFASLATESNPALGVRGYRTSRVHPELLSDQLTALARAAEDCDTECWVMAPMVSTPQEAAEFAATARAHGLAKVGVMIEVPSAALQASRILEHVDFLSLGTNDLAQYTMAADRLSSELADLINPWQPAVLHLVATTVRAGLAAAKPVGVCGESASDPVMALVLSGLGVTSLSMSPAAAGAVRFALQHHSLAECRQIASVALEAASATEAYSSAVAEIDPEVRAELDIVS